MNKKELAAIVAAIRGQRPVDTDDRYRVALRDTKGQRSTYLMLVCWENWACAMACALYGNSYGHEATEFLRECGYLIDGARVA